MDIRWICVLFSHCRHLNHDSKMGNEDTDEMCGCLPHTVGGSPSSSGGCLWHTVPEKRWREYSKVTMRQEVMWRLYVMRYSFLKLKKKINLRREELWLLFTTAFHKHPQIPGTGQKTWLTPHEGRPSQGSEPGRIASGIMPEGGSQEVCRKLIIEHFAGGSLVKILSFEEHFLS